MMCFNMLTSSLVILIYMNSGNTELMNDAEQLDTYNNIFREKARFSYFCSIQPELWASLCTLAVNHIAKESEDYKQMYLHYPAFRTTNDPNFDKCQDTKLFIPTIDEHVDLKHLVCHGRPIVIRTDEPDEKFSDKISIYIVNSKKLLILEKVDEGKHKLLKLVSTNMNCMRRETSKLLMIPSPQSTFDKQIIKSKVGDAANISDYEKTENHILRNIPMYSFVKLCYMIFSRSEYADEVKLLPKKKLQHITKGRPRTNNCFLYFFKEKMKFKVTMYTVPIFEEMRNRIFKLMAGPDENSVIVVKFAKNWSNSRPYELIENISLAHLDILVRM